VEIRRFPMKTQEEIFETVEALRWFVSYYPKWNGLDPCKAMEDAADQIEELSRELTEAKELAERRLKRKNMYKERATKSLEREICYRLKLKAIGKIVQQAYEQEVRDERSNREDGEK
jgi:hypothetical protein